MTPDHWISILKITLGFAVSIGLFKGFKWTRLKCKELNYYEMLATLHQSLADKNPADRVKSLDLEFKDGSRFFIPLIMGERVPVGPGVTIEGIHADSNQTTYLVQINGSWFLREHRHAENETVQVISGTMMDKLSGRRYVEGDTWEIKQNSWHSVIFEAPEFGPALIKIVIRPPLPSIEERPLKLDDMGRLAGVV